MPELSWALAAVAACAMVAASTPVIRRLAIAWDVVDHPGGHKSHSTPVPYLGGVAIIAGAVVAHVAMVGVTSRSAVILASAVLLGVVGGLDDRRSLHPLPRLAAQAGAAAAAIAVGVQVHITGIAAFDTAATLVWIVGITNALNFIDNMDALASSVTAGSAAAVFVLASAAHQDVVATAASALFGACLAFLLYNHQPATIYMGDAGSLFLGYLLAVVSVVVDPALPVPRSWLVPLLLLAVPVLDTTTVMLGRWRNGRVLYVGGRDHLSHRLVARGWSPVAAVMTLAGCQGALGACAVLVGRRWLPLWAGLVGASVVVAVLVWLTLGPDVYGRDAAQGDQR